MRRILVIDDEKDVRIVIGQVLEREGFDVILAEDGKQGIELLSRDSCDLVISDVIMPGIDGVAVVQSIREEKPDVPIIVISGGGNPSPMEYEPGAIATNAYLASAAQAGADRTLTKPFDRKQLVDTVRDLLGEQ